jgi:hypothetical protein
VEEWKRKFEADAESARIQNARQIQRLFVDISAPQQINIPESLREACEDSLSAAARCDTALSIDLFDAMSDDVTSVLSRDGFVRFKDTPLFEEFKQRYAPP